MFRKVAWLGILAFALPLAAFANEIGLTNGGGVVIGNAGGLALAGLVITGNGTNGVPNVVVFNGTFSSPVTWSLITLKDGTHHYTLSGALVAMNGEFGATLQLTVNTGINLFNGSAQGASGDTSLNIMVPEPGTLSLLGTGLIGVAGYIRWKRGASHL